MKKFEIQHFKSKLTVAGQAEKWFVTRSMSADLACFWNPQIMYYLTHQETSDFLRRAVPWPLGEYELNRRLYAELDWRSNLGFKPEK